MKFHHFITIVMILVIVVIGCFGCNDQQQRIADNLEIHHHDTLSILDEKIDSSWIRLNNTMRYLDSNRKYFDLAFKYDKMSSDNKILYYQTEDEKYMVLANKYDAIRVRYAKICNHYSDSLKNNK